MKIKNIIKKFLSVILCVSILTPGIFIKTSAGAAVGTIASFELADSETNKDILKTIVLKSKTKYIDMAQNNPYVYARFDFRNVKIYIDGGNTTDWVSYYWRVSSLDPSVADFKGQSITASEAETSVSENPETTGIYDRNYFLRADIKSVGTTIVTVEMSPYADMSNSIIRTFTLKIIDDSNNGQLNATFQRSGNSANLNLSVPMQMKITDINTSVSISSVSGLDYSNLNSGASFEKPIAAYSWTAAVSEPGIAKISLSGTTDSFSDTISSSVTSGAGNRTIYIKPLSEGTVNIVFTITPSGGTFQAGTQTIAINITKTVGNIDFNPTFDVYSSRTNPEDVMIKIEDLNVMVNDVKTNIDSAFMPEADLNITVTVPANKLVENYADTGWTDVKNTINAQKTFAIDSDFLYYGLVNVPLTDSAKVNITVSGSVYGESRSVTKTADVKFVTEADNGQIMTLKFGDIANPENISDIYEGRMVKVLIDKNGNPESTIELGNFEAQIYDISQPNLKRILDGGEYTVKAAADKTDLVSISVDDSSKQISIVPQKAGTVKIKVTAVRNDVDSAYSVQFTLNISNFGILPADEGTVVSVALKRNNGINTIYTGEDKILYLQNGISDYGALTVNIDRVLVSAANKASTNYTDVLKNFKWQINTTAGGTDSSLLSLDNMSGTTDTGKAAINIGTEKISTETDPILLTITVFPQQSDGIYDTGNKSMSVQFEVVVNGLGGKFALDIDYTGEKINILTDKIGEDLLYYNFNGSNNAVEYMYCLKAAADGASQSAEKWLPVMGSSIDISRVIPKTASSAVYRIGVRLADAVPEEDGNFSPDNRKTVILNPRRTVTAAEKKSVVYKDGQIMLNNEDAEYINVIYTVGACETVNNEIINGKTGISLPLRNNPLGSTVAVQFAAQIDSENPANSRFASVPFKIKVPRIGKMPVIKDDKRKGRYTGFNGKMSWSATNNVATGSADGWTKCQNGFVSYANLRLAFPGLQKDASGEFYNLYVKTDAYNKTPESDILVVKIPADRY
ncbi:MAG: hypothetical protein FWD71_14810 [Oscillospiraceae bacterium]|nr:hypothetical protein [Oscillospiraceae bacterium]